MLAAVDLGVAAIGLFHVTACLLQHIIGIIPALQMAAAQLTLLVFLVTGALSRLLYFDFMMRELFSFEM
jgi:hypothetical protein